MDSLFDISFRTKDAIKKEKKAKEKKVKDKPKRVTIPKDIPEGVITKQGLIAYNNQLYKPANGNLSLCRNRNVYYVKQKATILILDNSITDNELQREFYTPIIKGSFVKGRIVREADNVVFDIQYIKYPFDDKFYIF